MSISGIAILLVPSSDALPRRSTPQPATWVKLRHLPSPLSFDEALLLCREDEQRWVAWVPDFGELILRPEQFEHSQDKSSPIQPI